MRRPWGNRARYHQDPLLDGSAAEPEGAEGMRCHMSVLGCDPVEALLAYEGVDDADGFHTYTALIPDEVRAQARRNAKAGTSDTIDVSLNKMPGRSKVVVAA